MNDVKSYLKNHLYLNILLAFVSIAFYLSIPNVNILEIMNEYQLLTEKMDGIDATVDILHRKGEEFGKFVVIVKVILSLLLYIAIFTISYAIHMQRNSQEKIDNLSNEVQLISNTLSDHFEDYKIFIEYSRLQGSIIHHNFKEALKYDIERLIELKEGDTFNSTVILQDDYLSNINNIELLQRYINTIISKSNEGVKITRIYITEAPLTSLQLDHLALLYENDIDVRLTSKSTTREIARINRTLSKNFIIINNKEVAFAYPFYGDFKFAVNIINNEDREAKRYFEDYTKYFNKIHDLSDSFKKLLNG